MYTVALYTEEINESNLAIRKFFDSFKLREVEENPDYDKAEDGMLVPDYEIDFPAPTKVETKEIPDMDGAGYAHIRLCELGSVFNPYGTCGVMVRQFSLDPSEQFGFSYDAFFEKAVNDAIVGRGAELVSKKKIKRFGLEGVEFKERYKQGALIARSQTFLKGEYQYIIYMMMTPERYNDAEIDEFLNSFKPG